MPKHFALRFEVTIRIQSFMESDAVHSVRNLPKCPPPLPLLFSFLRPKCEGFFLFFRNGIKFLPRLRANVFFGSISSFGPTCLHAVCNFAVSMFVSLNRKCCNL